MYTLCQIILSLLPYYFDFPVDKLPESFSETIYLSKVGKYHKFTIKDRQIRNREIKKFFDSEINGWSYYCTFISYVPEYELKSENMIINYHKDSTIIVRYRDGNKWSQIMKKVTTPFPILSDANLL
jgi:hypothetical protein